MRAIAITLTAAACAAALTACASLSDATSQMDQTRCRAETVRNPVPGAMEDCDGLGTHGELQRAGY